MGSYTRLRKEFILPMMNRWTHQSTDPPQMKSLVSIQLQKTRQS
jgi:hypothetical protein